MEQQVQNNKPVPRLTLFSNDMNTSRGGELKKPLTCLMTLPSLAKYSSTTTVHWEAEGLSLV